MPFILGTATVADFETWKSHFDRNDLHRSDHGQQGYQVFRSADDPNGIVILFEWDDHEHARELFASDEMRRRLADAGVTGQPELTFLTTVDQRPATTPSA